MRSRDSALPPRPPVRVLQACFPERRIPNGTAIQRFARRSHPANAGAPGATPAESSGPSVHPGKPPHPATVVQARGMQAVKGRPPHPATVVQARPAFGSARPVQRKEADAHAFKPPDGFLEKPGPGHPLPSPVKLKMERYFGADFSDVRVHVGPEAASIGALAFTLGDDLYFAPEHYQPGTTYGQELLGHELTHVLQQRDGRVANPYGEGVAVVQDFDLEAEADMHGKAVAQGRPGPGNESHPAQPKRPPPGSKTGHVQRKNGYKLVVGAYMHEGHLPEALAGHSFVAIEDPGGERHAFGFSPAHYGTYDPDRDLGRLEAGVEGVVHDDERAFDKPGVKTRSYAITPEQAQAAMSKVSEYRSGRHRYSADRQQCSTFALDVLKAAHVPVPAPGQAPKPRVMYESLDSDPPDNRGRP